MNRPLACLVIASAALLGGGSLLLFGWFVVFGAIPFFRFAFSDAQLLLWNGALSLLFFIQHSGMVRRPSRAWLAGRVPAVFHAAAYAIASGLVLAGVVLFWQPLTTVVIKIDGIWRWLLHGVALLGVVGGLWGVLAFRDFDPFGRQPIRAALAGRHNPPPSFVVCGPYRWVRHPLYSSTLLLLWSMPDLSLDRLFFNLLWSAWIVLGAYLEERDLLDDFGEDYRQYQKSVPMLLPCKGATGFFRGHRRGSKR